MNYHVTVYTNEMLVEVRIATDPHPGAGFISARKFLFGLDGSNTLLPPATVWFGIGFTSDLSLDQVDDIKRWLTEASKMARRLDECVASPVDFTDAVSYEVRQVTGGVLILDKKAKE